MTGWLLDTFLYTGVLIAAVLVLRRPVARHFGAQIAYALWGLPFLRLLLPPIILPASFAPKAAPASMALGHGAQGGPVVMIIAEPAPLISWPMLALIVWLGGALAFLAWRVLTYRWMRQDLLDPARTVGEVGSIRLVETPEVSAPVAFGVLDKVVALPVLFMAQPDTVARDLAIAHELEHHRGRDLAANFAAQALLALHWFNPVAWYGWRAMRRDQEAACDARMLAGRGREERVRYAELIAGTAAGRHPFPFKGALAAPMACPVLGDASIIHRLRSFTMTDISSRRRWLGRALVAAGALTLPLTASFSYTAQAQDAPPPPLAPPAPPAVTAPPAAPEAGERRVERYVVTRDGPRRNRLARRERRREMRNFIIRRDGSPLAMAGPRIELRDWNASGDPEYQKRMEEWGRQMDEWGRKYGKDMGKWGEQFAKRWNQRGLAMARPFAAPNVRVMPAVPGAPVAPLAPRAPQLRIAPQVLQDCRDGSGTSETTLPDGRRQVVICNRFERGQGPHTQALESLRRTRERIAQDQRLSEDVRRDVTEDLDRAIESQSRSGGED